MGVARGFRGMLLALAVVGLSSAWSRPAAAGQALWLDRWEVVGPTSTFDEAINSIYVEDVEFIYIPDVSISMELPYDPAFDLIEDWGDSSYPYIRAHRTEVTLTRAFEVIGPGPAEITLDAVLYHYATIWPNYQGSHAQFDIHILRDGVEVVWLQDYSTIVGRYGGAGDSAGEHLTTALDPGSYTLRVEQTLDYARWYSQIRKPTYASSYFYLSISGIAPNDILPAAPVPEPSTLAMGGVAAVLGLGWRWRWRRVVG